MRDNLYKCCLISGLVLCLFTLALSYQFYQGIMRQSATLQVSTRRGEIEANDLFQKIDHLGKVLQAEGQTNADGTLNITMTDEDKRNTAKFLEDQRLSLNIKYAELKASNSEIARLHDLMDAVVSIGLALLVGGLTLFIYGFHMWRSKAQVIHDFLLQSEMDRIAVDKLKK